MLGVGYSISPGCYTGAVLMMIFSMFLCAHSGTLLLLFIIYGAPI